MISKLRIRFNTKVYNWDTIEKILYQKGYNIFSSELKNQIDSICNYINNLDESFDSIDSILEHYEDFEVDNADKILLDLYSKNLWTLKDGVCTKHIVYDGDFYIFKSLTVENKLLHINIDIMDIIGLITTLTVSGTELLFLQNDSNFDINNNIHTQANELGYDEIIDNESYDIDKAIIAWKTAVYKRTENLYL